MQRVDTAIWIGSKLRIDSTTGENMRKIRTRYATDRIEEPPRYQPPAPSGAMAKTGPSTMGKSGATSRPVEASSITAEPVVIPTRVKLPPT